MSTISTTSFSRPIDRQSLQPIEPTTQEPSYEKSKLLALKANAHSPVKTFQLNRPSTPDVPAVDPRLAEARTAAEGLVSATFIEPILKQVRESNTAPPPFGPSNAEKQFSALLDTNLADEIVHAANFPLVQRMADQMLRNMPAPETQSTHQPLDIQG